MEQSKKPKTSSEFSFSDESSASSSSSSSSSSGDNLRSEEMVEGKKETVSSRKIQKAEREKVRRDKLNEQFLELGNALDPNRPKSDKATILIDTIQVLKDLMTQVDRLKAEYVALSQESRELTQEKSELREEKTCLKSDIEALNSQYQHRVRTMVPWIPHYTYPVPLVAITQGPLSTLPFPLHGTQNPAPLPNPCSTFMPYSAPSLSPKTEQKDDVGLELELKIHASSSAQQNVSGKEKKGNSTDTASSSSSSSQGVQDSSLGNVNNILKS